MRQLIQQISYQYNVSREDATSIVKLVAIYAEEVYPGLGNSFTGSLTKNIKGVEDNVSDVYEVTRLFSALGHPRSF